MYTSIPTEYNGVRFRSRLEASYAAFWDLKAASLFAATVVTFSEAYHRSTDPQPRVPVMCVQGAPPRINDDGWATEFLKGSGRHETWEYEPVDFSGWIPDFRLKAGDSLLYYVEVKPTLAPEITIPARLKIDLAATPDVPILLLGDHPNSTSFTRNKGVWKERPPRISSECDTLWRMARNVTQFRAGGEKMMMLTLANEIRISFERSWRDLASFNEEFLTSP